MAEPTPERIDIPVPNDDDFLDRVERAVRIARDFKGLVIELCYKDWTKDDETQDELAVANADEIDKETGRFLPQHYVRIHHGDHKVVPSRSPEVDRANVVETSIFLTSPEGGRRYEMVVLTDLDLNLELYYDEDLPDKAGSDNGSHDILGRFMTATEMAGRPGIHYPELDVFESVVKGIRAVQSKNRLKHTECLGL